MFKNQILFTICIFTISVQNCGLLNFWNSKNHEIRTSHYDDGSLEYKASYFNDRLDGPSYYYNSDGILLSYAEYKNGSPHGIWETFYDTGEVQSNCSYFHSHKHGEEKFYYTNGQLQSLIKYEYGKETAKMIRWNKDGELLY